MVAGTASSRRASYPAAAIRASAFGPGRPEQRNNSQGGHLDAIEQQGFDGVDHGIVVIFVWQRQDVEDDFKGPPPSTAARAPASCRKRYS